MYKIGQILFVLNTQSMQLLPVQVIERQVSEALGKGKSTMYTVKYKDKLLKLPPNSKHIFSSLNEAEVFIKKNMMDSLAKILKRAQKLQSTLYPQQAQAAPSTSPFAEMLTDVDPIPTDDMSHIPYGVDPNDPDLAPEPFAEMQDPSTETIVQTLPSGKELKAKIDMESIDRAFEKEVPNA